MSELKYARPERLSLRDRSDFDENWVKDRIFSDPSLLGLGDLVPRDRERPQPHAGRLDLLFQEVDVNRRYEIEVQLGSTDESHIIRTLEYWDIERKRYPQYEHTAVIVAENITSRFLNVISLFNGLIPLVAIQMQALRLGDQVSLVFTKVLDQVQPGPVEEPEDTVAVDRSYWEGRASKVTLEIVDLVIEELRKLDAELSPKLNRYYIGIMKNGRSNNFVSMTPKKSWLWLGLRLPRSDDAQKLLDRLATGESEYDVRAGRYWVRLTKPDLSESYEPLKELLARAYAEEKP